MSTTTTNIYQFLTQQDFAVSFWSNLLSTVLVSVVAALVVNRFTNIFKQPKLSLVVKQGGLYRNSVIVGKRADNKYEASFSLAINNTGNKAIETNEGSWHVYFPNASSTHMTGDDYSSIGEPNHHRDYIRYPIFPKSFFDLGVEYKILIEEPNLTTIKIRYFFETIYGYFPSTVKLNPETGFVLFEDMEQIGFVEA